MNTNKMLLVIAAATFGSGVPAIAQIAGGWATQGDTVSLSAADGSQTITFMCDVVSGEMIVSSTLNGVGVQPGRITVRADNGTAYSVPMRAEAAGMRGKVSMSLVNQGGFSPATTLIVTSPPSDRQAIIADVSPEFATLMSNCPRL